MSSSLLNPLATAISRNVARVIAGALSTAHIASGRRMAIASFAIVFIAYLLAYINRMVGNTNTPKMQSIIAAELIGASDTHRIPMVAGVSIVPITALASFKIFFIVFWCFSVTYLFLLGAKVVTNLFPANFLATFFAQSAIF